MERKGTPLTMRSLSMANSNDDCVDRVSRSILSRGFELDWRLGESWINRRQGGFWFALLELLLFRKRVGLDLGCTYFDAKTLALLETGGFRALLETRRAEQDLETETIFVFPKNDFGLGFDLRNTELRDERVGGVAGFQSGDSECQLEWRESIALGSSALETDLSLLVQTELRAIDQTQDSMSCYGCVNRMAATLQHQCAGFGSMRVSGGYHGTVGPARFTLRRRGTRLGLASERQSDRQTQRQPVSKTPGSHGVVESFHVRLDGLRCADTR